MLRQCPDLTFSPRSALLPFVNHNSPTASNPDASGLAATDLFDMVLKVGVHNLHSNNLPVCPIRAGGQPDQIKNIEQVNPSLDEGVEVFAFRHEYLLATYCAAAN